MDISKLSTGAKLVLGASIALLVVSLFNWQEVDVLGLATAGVNMWHGWGVLAGLVAVAIVVWEGMRLVGMKVEFGLSPTMTTAALAALLVLFTVLKFLISNEFRTFWAWLGLLLAIVVAVGAWMNMTAQGESIGELGASVKSAATSAAASAKSATGSSSDAGTHAADTTPPASSEPAEEQSENPPPPPPV